MADTIGALPAHRLRTLSGSLETGASAEDAFTLIRAVEKWPVWLSFIRSARLADPNTPLVQGSDVIIRAAIPGDEEQHFEVDRYLENHQISLVGAYSVRRRIDFRIERRMLRNSDNIAQSRIHVRIDYPSYHGRIAAYIHHLTHGRKLAAALQHSLVLFRGLVEYRQEPDALLADL